MKYQIIMKSKEYGEETFSYETESARNKGFKRLLKKSESLHDGIERSFIFKEEKEEITINTEQKLYIIPEGKGFSCLGFDICEKRSTALAKEMNEKRNNTLPGTIEHYNEYLHLIEIAHKKNQATGWRSNSELTPEFIGHEGEQVKIIQRDGLTRHFYIGKSTSFIPIHLEINRKNSSGGSAVCLLPGDTWVFTGKRL